MTPSRSRLARRALVVGSVTVMGFGLAACSSGGSSSSGSAPVTSISVADYYTDEPAKSIIGDALNACGTAAGVTIQREQIPSTDLVSKTLQKLSSKTLPDIQMIDNPDLPALATTGALQVLTDAGVTTDNVGASVLSVGTVDGKVYGIAPTVSVPVMFYNVDLFTAAGITDPPATWAELKADAAKLTNGDTYGVAFSAKNDAQGVYDFLPLLWSAGGSEDELDSQAAQDALQLEVDLVQGGDASQSVVQWGNSDLGDQFLAGKAAMAIVSASQMAKFDKAGTLNYKIASIPVPTAGGTAVNPLGGEVWTLPITGDDARQAKAAEVLECLKSDDTQLSLAVKRGTVPANPALDEKYLAQLPTLTAFVEQVRDGRARTGILGADWADASTKIYTAVQAAVTGQASVSDALKTAAQ
ncbi:MAG: multiple sugar transport system substrate-binding protein [Subtercola sp.]|nr:multiple sugar transport system substrate-binding protein [Subtercola sp.]